MTDEHVLRSAFLQKQRHLMAALEIVPQFTSHGTTIGDDSEANWARVLRDFLPGRYGIAKGHVMDSRGATSQQIDLLVYDSQYTPLLAQSSAGDLFVPAEAVYAVFEVKQESNRRFMEYAGTKIASVRDLHRTSVPITHAGGTFEAKEPITIIGGLLTTRSGWADMQGRDAVQAVMRLNGNRRVDLGCALSSVAFDRPDNGRSDGLEYSESDTTLLFFLFRLFNRLQKLGTVAAVDISAYMNRLDFIDESSPSAGLSVDREDEQLG